MGIEEGRRAVWGEIFSAAGVRAHARTAERDGVPSAGEAGCGPR